MLKTLVGAKEDRLKAEELLRPDAAAQRRQVDMREGEEERERGEGRGEENKELKREEEWKRDFFVVFNVI